MSRNSTVGVTVVGVQVLDVLLLVHQVGVGLAGVLADGPGIPHGAALLDGSELGHILVGGLVEDVALLLPVGLQVADAHADFVVVAGDVDKGAVFLNLTDPLDGAFRVRQCSVEAVVGDGGRSGVHSCGSSRGGEGAAGQGDSNE